ncbi:MAG: hypothetical protein ACKPKO_29015, partial [Candidatus Fonsibacter sp.]
CRSCVVMLQFSHTARSDRLLEVGNWLRVGRIISSNRLLPAYVCCVLAYAWLRFTAASCWAVAAGSLMAGAVERPSGIQTATVPH